MTLRLVLVFVLAACGCDRTPTDVTTPPRYDCARIGIQGDINYIEDYNRCLNRRCLSVDHVCTDWCARHPQAP